MPLHADSREALEMLPTSVDVAFSINRAIRDKLPHFVDLMPFRSSYDITVGRIGALYIYRIEDTSGRSQSNLRLLSDAEREFLTTLQDELPRQSGEALYSLLGRDWVGWNKFTYVGQMSWMSDLKQYMGSQLHTWANLMLIPSLEEINRRRIAAFPPTVVAIDKMKVMSALWVLESEKQGTQGTAFHLEGVGLVTAAHALADDTIAFQASAITNRKPVKILRRNDVIDLAVISCGDLGDQHVTAASNDDVAILDAIALAGFPNYRYGDSGTLVTGSISGFRMHSGIRRVLVDAPIIAGNSGSPVFNKDGRVIGVAVTGADYPENITTTEYHSFVPIDALSLI